MEATLADARGMVTIDNDDTFKLILDESGSSANQATARLDSGEFIPRAGFQFECKRLGRRHTVKIYLGSEGLGCFCEVITQRRMIRQG